MVFAMWFHRQHLLKPRNDGVLEVSCVCIPKYNLNGVSRTLLVCFGEILRKSDGEIRNCL